MVEIRIDNTGDGTWWLYNDNDAWKGYCGCDNFDEQVILAGNRHYKECTDAEWYQKAKEVIEDIDCYELYPEYTSEEVNVKLKELYDKCRCTEDIIVDVLRLLYPEDTFKDGTIRGYCQSDWQNYIIKGDVDTDLLEAMYFGNISDITVKTEDEEFSDIITHDELWKAERENGGLKEYFRKRYKLDKDEEIRILQADGYKQIIDWKEIV